MIPFVIGVAVFFSTFLYAGFEAAAWSGGATTVLALILGAVYCYWKDHPKPTCHDLTPQIVYEQVDKALRTVHYKRGRWDIRYDQNNPRTDREIYLHAEYEIKNLDPDNINEVSYLYLDASIEGTDDHQTMLTLVWKPEATISRWQHNMLIDTSTQRIQQLIEKERALSKAD